MTRRRILGVGAMGAAAASVKLAERAMAGPIVGEEVISSMGNDQEARARLGAGRWDVSDFGARGDGSADNTRPFQKALDAAGRTGGGEVYAPPGQYVFRGSLNVPPATSLVGSFLTVPAHNGIRDAGLPKPGDDGTTLMPRGGADTEDGPPFITLNTNSVLRGVTVWYPDQDPKARPRPYPWTVAMKGKNPAVLDTELLNPFNAIDTTTTERHLIRCVHGQPLRRGIKVDQIYDIGRIENVHWNPWWSMAPPVMKFMEEEGEAFILAKTDWEYMVNCFCIMYAVGFRFTKFEHGPGNVVLTQCGSDVGPVAALIEDCQAHAGIAFTNGQFMAGIKVTASNTGPVKFHNCGFWPIPTTDWHARLEGSGHVTFNGCHFSDWAAKTPHTPAIIAHNSGLTVMGCDFMAAGKAQMEIGAEVKSAIVLGNRLRGGEKIVNRSEGAQIGFNTAG